MQKKCLRLSRQRKLTVRPTPTRRCSRCTQRKITSTFTEFENQNGRSLCLFASTCPPKNPGTRTLPESKARCISIGRDCVYLARSERKETVWTSLERKLDRRGACTTRVLYRAAPEHSRPATKREMGQRSKFVAEPVRRSVARWTSSLRCLGRSVGPRSTNCRRGRGQKETRWRRKV